MPGGGISGCQGCNGRCCHRYVVPLTGLDAYVLATQLLLAVEQFAAVVAEKETTPTGFRLAPGGPTHTLVLDKRVAEAEPTACVFLATLADGVERCGVYAHRPLACRAYPGKLHHGVVTVRADAMCPPEAWNVSGQDLPAWRRELLRMELEWVIYAIVVERWNKFVDSASPEAEFAPSVFLGYLMNAYARLEQVRAGQAPQDPPWSDLIAAVTESVQRTLEPAGAGLT